MSDGTVLFDKPVGVTSHDVVYQVRNSRQRIKTGHAGTLDPFASGLLIILLGRATRLQRFLMGLPKEYVVRARFGALSTTGDLTGEITETGIYPDLDKPLPTGAIKQRPPLYSAIKINGERAYSKARRGEQFTTPLREVQVERFQLLERSGDEAKFLIRCSSGTYVRSLIEDLGDGYCLELRRTQIGPFSVDQADPERLLSLQRSMSFMPQLILDQESAQQAAYGCPVEGSAEGPVCLVDQDGLIAIAEPRDSFLKPVVGFR